MALVAHWPLNGNANDISGNGFHGTENSMAYSAGKIGQAATYDGTTTPYIQLPVGVIQNLNDFSITFWIKYSSFNDRFVLSVENTDAANYILIGPESTTVRAYIGATYYGFSLASVINTWYHFTLTRKGNSLALYRDGQLISSQTCITTALTANGAILLGQEQDGVLTGFSAGQAHHGQLNDFRIYDHALTDFEIQEIARAKILHYTFNDLQEPTTNLADSIQAVFSAWGTPAVTGTSVYETLKNGKQAIHLTSIYSGSGGVQWRRTNNGNLIPVTPATAYTMSAFIKYTNNNPSANLFYLRQYRADNSQIQENGWYSTSYRRTLKDGWYYAWRTVTLHAECVNVRLESYEYSTNEIWMYDFQFEKKDHATPYVYGTRTGQVKDYSGFFNHSDDLTELTTPKWISDTKIGLGTYYFNGIGSPMNIIDVNKPFSGALDKYTICFWAKNDDAGTGNMPIAHRTNTSFYWYGDNSWRYTHGGVGGEYYYPKSVSIPVGSWGHFCVVYDGTNVKIYRNGVYEGQQSSTGTADFSSGFRIGNWTSSSTYQYNGNITDVRIYATALSAIDIKDIYETRAEIEETGILYAKDFLSNAEETINLHGDPILINTYVEDQAVSKSNWGVDGTLFARKNTAPEAPANALMLEMNITSAGSGGLYTDLSRGNGLEYTLIEGKTYTRSWWAKCSDTRSISGHVCSSNRASDNNYIVGGNITVTPEWQKFSHTFTVAAGQGGSYHTRHIIYNEIFSVWVANIQIEERSYYTPFVTTYRPPVDLPSTLVFAANEIHETGTANFEDFSTVGITNGLVGYWDLNGNTKDYSGNNSHGTIYGGVVSRGDYYNFDGEDNSYIDMGNTPALAALGGTSNITIAALVRYSAYDGGAESYSVITYKGTPWTWLVENPSSRIRFRITAGGVDTNIADPDIHPLNEWLLVIGTYDGSNMKIYVNGIEKNSKAQTGTLGSTSQPMRVGTYNTNAYMFHGDISYIKIFNRALTAEEVKLEYNTMLNNEVQIHESGILYAKDLIQY